MKDEARSRRNYRGLIVFLIAPFNMLMGCTGAEEVQAGRPDRQIVASADADRTAIDEATLPDLRGRSLDEVGDQTGILYLLWDLIGRQQTVNFASDVALEGEVFDQDPPPGTSLQQIGIWTLYVSAGGPVVQYSELPNEVAEFARQLPGFDPSEPLVTRAGAYKTDKWLFSLDCNAVAAAYRTFLDARYDTACPGDIQIAPSGCDRRVHLNDVTPAAVKTCDQPSVIVTCGLNTESDAAGSNELCVPLSSGQQQFDARFVQVERERINHYLIAMIGDKRHR